jgi:hypothetical protein
MRFVHSRGDLGLLLGRAGLDRCRALRGIRHRGEVVRPWSRRLHVSRDVLPQSASAFPCVGPCALGVDIATHPRTRVGTRTGRREPEARQAGVARQPLLNGFGGMHTVGIHHARETWHPGSGGRLGQPRPAGTQPSRVGARAEAMPQLARGERPGPSPRGLLVLPRRPDLCRRPLRPPSRPARGQQGQSKGSRTDPHRRRWPVCGMQPQAGPPLAPGRGGICGHPLGPFPAPAPRVEPAPDGFRRPRAAVLGLARGRQGSPTPAGAAPARGAGSGVAHSAQRPLAPGHQDGRAPRRRQRPVRRDGAAQRPVAIGAHDAGDAGAGAAQAGRHRGRGAAGRTPP